MKTVTLNLAFIASVLFASCNSGGPDSGNTATTAIDSAKTASQTFKADSGSSNGDAQFATKAIEGGMLEIQLGSLCAQKAQNKQVKDFGAMMVTDHTKANNALKDIGANKNITLPTALNSDDQKMVDDIAKKDNADFDKAYIDMMVKGHMDVLDAFKNEANTGKDSTIRAFAANTIPTIEKHLKAAKEAQQAVAGK